MEIQEQIEKIVKKKKWTGEEVGRLALLILALDVSNMGNEDYVPPITGEQFANMTQTIEKPKDRQVFAVYGSVFNTTKQMINQCRTLVYRFTGGCNRLLRACTLAYRADVADNYLKSLPIIMTRKQYERELLKAKANLEGYTETFEGLIFVTLKAFMNTKQETPTPIKEALEALKKQPAQSELLKYYPQVMGLGYYKLADGRRSDSMSLKEWQKTLDSMRPKVEGLELKETVQHYRNKEIQGATELYFKGFKELKKAYKNITGDNFPTNISEADAMKCLENVIVGITEDLETKRLYEGKRPLENQEVRIAVLTAVYGTSGAEEAADAEGQGLEWIDSTETPQDLTSYEFLEAMIDTYEGLELEEVNAEQGIEAFKKDYSALYHCLYEYIKGNVLQLKEGDSISWGELAHCNFLDYVELTTPTEETVISQYEREKASGLLQEGIAILENPQPFQLDEQGNYKGHNGSAILNHTVDSIYALNEKEFDYEVNTTIKYAIYNPLKFMYAFNSFLEIVGEIFKVNELAEAGVATEECEEAAQKYNYRLFEFYANVSGSEQAKADKRKLIKDIFTPLELEALKPNKKDIALVRKQLKLLKNKETAAQEITVGMFTRLLNILGAGNG